MRRRSRIHGDCTATASDGITVTDGTLGSGVGAGNFSMMMGAADSVVATGRCGAELHATSVKHATPSVQQLVPSAARRQSRALLLADTRLLISREECFARIRSRQRRPCAAPKKDAHYTSVGRDFIVST